MAMGMAMAKKMMAQMGEGGSPMEMMQKMMAQMSQGDDKPPMEKMMGMCMGMCSEMLNAIRQTNALAVFATPELQHAFADWLKEIEGKAEALLADSEKDAQIRAFPARVIFPRMARRARMYVTLYSLILSAAASAAGRIGGDRPPCCVTDDSASRRRSQ